METVVLNDAKALGVAAGKAAAALIREAIHKKGNASVILATGASQFETLNQLIAEKDIDWSKVTMFHLDEYIGLPVTHNASFRKYLSERFIANVPSLKEAVLISGEGDAEKECDRLNKLIAAHPIDVALVAAISGTLHLTILPQILIPKYPILLYSLMSPAAGNS